MKPLVAICVGHNAASRGADPDGDGPLLSEYELHTMVAIAIVSELNLRDIPAIVFRRSATVPYQKQMTLLTEAVNAIGASCAIELHSNSVPPGHVDDKATFALCWPGAARAKQLGEVLAKKVSAVLKTRDRGCREQRVNDRGTELYFMKWTKMPAVILETHNVMHTELHKEALHYQALAVVIAAGIEEWLRIQGYDF